MNTSSLIVVIKRNARSRLLRKARKELLEEAFTNLSFHKAELHAKTLYAKTLSCELQPTRPTPTPRRHLLTCQIPMLHDTR